ncbi:Formyltransferase [Daldinia vernicosa]|uniref:Formyltransferase n=1 Tax=Daldinia vernicosa TaxID=114800 RepID=UPI0020079A51|nr:Formyltransferase [Daldinia vernicosa]KAI0853172.1 Formyltransferase [Daldinia vernicosa]
MRPLLRQVAAAPLRSKPCHELLRTRELDVLLLRSSNTLIPQPAMRRSTQLSRGCNACRQIRRYGSNATTTLIPPEDVNLVPPEDVNLIPLEDVKWGKAKKSDPLRILFCGSDEFSCASLEALHEEHLRNPALIQSIDVVVRPGKRTGRGNKIIQHPPIRDLAKTLGLPIHKRDTFTGWNMPSHTNLIIAVSFGLFVPPRLLHAAQYGGLNIHPSLLPDLRGPAPLQHALLAGRAYTGISLQTLDDRAFDHGLVLARTPPLPIPSDTDYAALLALVTPLAAELLVQGLRRGVHVPPLEEAGEHALGPEESEGQGQEVREVVRVKTENLLHAPKITKQDRQLRASNLPQLWRRYRALGPLWFWARDRQGVRKRVIIERVAGEDAGLADVALAFTLAADMSSSFVFNLHAKQKEILVLDAAAYAAADGVGPSVPRLVAFEQDDNTAPSIDGIDISETANSAGQTRLVLWFPEGDSDVCYLGPCRIEMIKVEGDKAKPAARALKDFLVSVELPTIE